MKRKLLFYYSSKRLFKFSLYKISRHIHPLLHIDCPPGHILHLAGGQPHALPQQGQLTGLEEVAPGPVLARVELLRYLGARLEPQHGHVIEAIIPEQKPASRAEDSGEAAEYPGVRVEYYAGAYFL